MDILDAILAHVIYSSVIASIIIVLLLLLKRICGNRLSARVYHIMWLLVLIRLMMPFEIESPCSLVSLLPNNHPLFDYSQDYISSEFDRLSPAGGQPSPATHEPELSNNSITAGSSPFNLTVFSRLWLIGVISAASLTALAALRFKRRSKNFAKVQDPETIRLVEECCSRLGIAKSIPVYMDVYFNSPCITGIFRPAIYLPQDIIGHIYHHQLEHVLLHELAHYKRKDLVFGLWAAAAGMIHWFNPLVWVAIMEMRRDREVAADLHVMELLGESAIIPYGTTLIKLASVFPGRSSLLNLASFNGAQKLIERRITMLKAFKEGSYRLSFLAIIVLILIGTVTLALTSSAKQNGNSVLNPNVSADKNSISIADNKSDRLIVIDPGHGGQDYGGVYPFDTTDPELAEVKEKSLNLEIALLLSDMLRKSGYQVVMTRENDSMVELDDRIKLANTQQADLVVSIHNDVNPDESISGTRTFYYSTGDQIAREISEIIQVHLVRQLGTKDLGTCNTKFKLLNETEMPTVITEIAYISNESDRGNLQTEAFKIEAAQALHDGIVEVLGKID